MPVDSTTSDPSLVSVIITTYDRPEYLRSAIESVRAQQYDPIELIVIDDHSPEPASTVVDSMDLRNVHSVRVRRHDENRGANAARNTGIRVARGEYVAFLDDDDRWAPEKLDRQIAMFRHDGVGVVYTGIEKIVDGERVVNRREPIDGDMTKALLCQNVVGTLSTVCVRADVAKAVPLDERFPSWADLEWYIRLSRETTFGRIPDPLVTYEFSAHNRLSEDVSKERRSYELFLEEFEPLAAEYGRLFRRKMKAWASYRLGSTALYNGEYDIARKQLGTAVLRYPFEPRFVTYFLATLGGEVTYDLARATNVLFS